MAHTASMLVDEYPQPVEVRADFGTFTASWEPSKTGLLFQRELELHAAVVPAAEYKTVRQFFQTVARAQSEQVIVTME